MKAYVVGYRAGVRLGRTITGHAAGGRNKFTNAKKLKISNNSYSLRVGESAVPNVKTVKEKKKKELPDESHCERLRYQSSNNSVATVDKNGEIKAAGPGSCNIWVYAQNGRNRKIAVVVR